MENSSTESRVRRSKIGSKGALVAGATSLGLVVIAGGALTLANPASAVPVANSICHSTGNGSYVLIGPDDDGIASGHSHHDDDIIPNSRNWVSPYVAIWNNNCVVPSPSPTTSVTPTPTVTVTVTATPTATATITAQPTATPTVTVTGEPSPTVTVTAPGTNTTNTVTVPGPTVTVTASPSVTPSAVPPVAVAPEIAPSAQPPVAEAPGALEPVSMAPVAAAVPTAVNAGDGSSQNKPMSPLGIVLMALAGIGVLYAALKLSTQRRSTSSH